jgi:L-threonylcarbamoyladenylate synthase
LSILGCDTLGVRAAVEALRGGAAVLLPAPTPLPYGVVGHAPEVVNGAKGRPLDQAVALWVTGGLGKVRPWLALGPDRQAAAEWLLREEMVTLLLPVTPSDSGPDWLRPAVRDGFVLLAGPELPALATLHRGNPTTRRPAVTAAEADEAFGSRLLVLDGDPYRDFTRPHASTTMLRLGSDGTVRVARSGVQDAATGPDAYLQDLLRRCPVNLRN